MQRPFFIKVIAPLLFFGMFSGGIYAQEKLIKEGDEWQYFDEGIPQDNWMNYTVSDEQWKSGVSPLGYGDDVIETIISYGKDSTRKDISKYFKKTFAVENPFAFLIYELRVQRDDGIVVYLNGREVMRDNMPSGKIKANTRASNLIYNRESELIFHSKTLSSEDFVAGINNIAVSVHQARRASSDCRFNLELIGHNDVEMLPMLLKERTMKNMNIEARLKALNFDLEMEKKDLRLQVVEQVKNNYRVALYTIIGLFIAALISTIYIFRSKQKKEIGLLQNNKNLKDLNTHKDRELMNASLNTVQNQQLLKELKHNLENTALEDVPSIKREVKKIIRHIDYNIETDDDWLSLLHHFNSVHIGFFDRLKQLHGTLTESEQRHCVFIKLRMQTKEIAQILHIDPRSVQASRYRIKKKMNLGENADLRDYILKL